MLKYFTNLVKSLLNRKPSSLPPPDLSWKDILKNETPAKRRRTMLLPSNRVLLWRVEEAEKDKNKKKQTQTGLNFLFQFVYDDIPYVIQTQRPFGQNFVSDALPKISILMQKKVFGNKADPSKNQVSIKVNESSDYTISPDDTVNTFADDTRITSLLVNDEEYQVVRNGIPISSVCLAMTPIAGQLYMPTIVYNVEDTPVQLHWFVKNEVQIEKPEEKVSKKQGIDALKLSFLNEKERKYNLNGYTYRLTGKYFSPDKNDIGRLVAVVVDSGIDHPVNAAISLRPVMESPEEIVTDEQVKWCKENPLKDRKTEVRLMCYNILADLYMNLNKAQEDLFFSYCPRAYQRVVYRTPIFLKQLQDFIDADVSIMFLQEVDMSRHESFIKPFLKTVNFQSEVSKKMRQISEGVAIAFDQKKFRSIYSNSFALADLTEEDDVNEDIRKILKSSNETREKYSTRPTIVQIVILESIETETIFICGNTHLHHNPLDEHIKAFQALVCVRKIMEMYKEKKRTNPEKNIRVIFGGDFNSLPDGPVFPLLSEGFLPKDHKDWTCDGNVVAEDLRIEQKMDCLTGTPEYTNYTADTKKKGFVGCLDYIWGIDVEAVRICPMPSHEKVILHEGLPAAHSPSDHLPIICDIKL